MISSELIFEFILHCKDPKWKNEILLFLLIAKIQNRKMKFCIKNTNYRFLKIRRDCNTERENQIAMVGNVYVLSHVLIEKDSHK